MKRENSVQDYLSRIDRLLRPLPVTERMDIMQEIRSTIAEMQADGTAEAEICARLGDQCLRGIPRHLREEPLAAALHAVSPRLRAFTASLALRAWSCCPRFLVLAAGMLISAVLAPVAGIIDFGGFLFWL